MTNPSGHTSGKYCGRVFIAADLAIIRQLIASDPFHPHGFTEYSRVEPWRLVVVPGHRVTLDEVRDLVDGAERLIVGSGWQGAVSVEPEVKALPGVEVEVLPTPEAVERYEELKGEGARVALLMHTTC